MAGVPGTIHVPVTAERTRVTQQLRTADIMPEEFIEDFHARHLHLRWGSDDEVQQGMDSTLEFSPVLLEDLDEELQARARQLFKVHPDGTLTRGDMILQYRTFAAAQRQRDEEEEMRRMQEDPERQLDQFEDDIHALVGNRPGVVDRRRSSIPPVRDQVVQGLPKHVLDVINEVVAEKQAATDGGPLYNPGADKEK